MCYSNKVVVMEIIGMSYKLISRWHATSLDMTSDRNVFVLDLAICLGPPTISKQAT